MSKPDFEVRLLLVDDKMLCGDEELVKNRSTSFAKMRILMMMMAMDSWGRGAKMPAEVMMVTQITLWILLGSHHQGRLCPE